MKTQSCRFFYAAYLCAAGICQTNAQKIHFLVRDSTDSGLVEGIDVKYYYRNARQYVYGATTNSRGLASFFIPDGGDTLSFEDKRNRFVSKKILRTSVNQDTIPIFLNKIIATPSGPQDIPKVEPPVIVEPPKPTSKSLNGFVYNQKTLKPVKDARLTIAHTDSLQARTNEAGYYQFPKLPFDAGEIMRFTIERPKYKKLEAPGTLTGLESTLNFELQPKWRPDGCDYLLFGAGISAVAAGVGYPVSRATYNNDYKNFKNPEREAAKTKADLFNRVAFVGIRAALLLAGAGLVCKYIQKKKTAKRRRV